MELLTTPQTKCKAKSTLNKSPEYACKHIFDGRFDTCWNSEQGSPQFICILFDAMVQVHEIKIMFQGGFCGQEGIVEVGNNMDTLQRISELESIEDNNELQCFVMRDVLQCGKVLKITFNSSTDFYGRVTIYNLMVYGNYVSE